MKPQEFLKQYETATIRVNMLRSEYEKEQEMIDALRSPSAIDGMPRSKNPGKSSVENKAIILAAKAEELKEAEAVAIDARQKVFNVIAQIDGYEGRVLYERYINLKNQREITNTLHYSRGTIYHMHKRAMEQASLLINKNN